MRIYIIQSNFNNNNKYLIHSARKLIESLVDAWGLPSAIISSPYESSRLTTGLLKGLLESENNVIPIRVDKSLAEYKPGIVTVDKYTSLYSPPMEENISLFRHRLWNHHDQMSQYDKDDNIWYVASKGVINQLFYLYNFIVNGKKLKSFNALIIQEENNINDVKLLHKRNLIGTLVIKDSYITLNRIQPI